MTAAICDDEKILRDQIEGLIKGQETGWEIKQFASGEELLGQKDSFDVIFLDIRMEGINGIETARALREKQEDSILIFVTGLKEYVFQAFDVSAFHYLLKPIEENAFARVFARAAAEAGRRREKEEGSLAVRARGRTVMFSRGELLYVESRNRMVEFHTTKGILEAYFDMGRLEKELGRCFFRCHRGYIVNMGYIAEYGKDSISLTSGETVYLSRRKYGEFVKAYMDYLKHGGTLFGGISSGHGAADPCGRF